MSAFVKEATKMAAIIVLGGLALVAGVFLVVKGLEWVEAERIRHAYKMEQLKQELAKEAKP